MSYVPQNSQLFNKSILENIAFDNDRLHRSYRRVAALKAAEAYQFVEKLEHGVDTMPSDNGMNLSEGSGNGYAWRGHFIVTLPSSFLMKRPMLLTLGQSRPS